MKVEELQKTAIDAAIKAGKEILKVYHSNDFDINIKSDNSPLTRADKIAHEIISEILTITGLPVLSEEGKNIPYETRKNWNQFWLVDPLDGTKEFINRNGEFTVNIALIKENEPAFGVIYVPVTKDLYFGGENMGSYKIINIDETVPFTDISTLVQMSFQLPFFIDETCFTVVASKSHLNQETIDYIDNLKSTHNNIEFVSKGSSLKLCMVAEGTANIYPRFGPTMEWDIAAGHAIAFFSGCSVTGQDEKTPLSYNKKELLNPGFIVKR
ncbi:MAG: 3'(2'),5'-bisphosphate nucleotidase [Bacteroidetes bacterium GWC2_33_15]|nr:MAG: 3'(2'),5'-bisphosphate nucleotidase [Bacteroidetes bacterium GWA2_33_15]OFX48628.1 MAG: 3'(2'),5'-bisphosphate nucleotidase [Bacteroidetes bacterium GWC2_33_15]OFX64602.1 MAG: 3'(2'),5'-bisphosphate nucleotidase [Bacteroidetes bacterium GWB2_32_14]OFX67980.1 MAG: 3'(2'),5'-bisphosphate nucleotidase [Bacteroidetes bacterium GWD2_33_33]HAN18214.1 3'(2'),5'-bisphosphate nucleotidase [Bacteroidales bacterium]